MVKSSRFITATLHGGELGRRMKDREKMLGAFFLKAVYHLPTTKVLIENWKTNPSLQRLCSWEYRGEVPSQAAISSSASLHDSPAAIPLVQISSERAMILYDLADCTYDAEEMKVHSEKWGHVPVIDLNPRRGNVIELAPARKGSLSGTINGGAGQLGFERQLWRTTCSSERTLEGPLPSRFGVIAISMKQLFNMLE